VPSTYLDAERAVELAARDSYGRLLAFLVSRTGDVAGAEDALADGFLRALETWPRTGVPDRPEAWLLKTARRRQIDSLRRQRATSTVTDSLLAEAERLSLTPQSSDLPETEFPDERLKLLFLCTHPAIDSAARTPLMLQTALGIDAATIANAFLVAPTAMGQRLTRAKAKIRRAAIRIDAPLESELSERVDAVLDAIYTAYGLGWDRGVIGEDTRWRGLAAEAIWLARLTVALLPDEPEAKGLLALMLFCESRHDARRTKDGAYVPLSDQDAKLWSRPLIDEAEDLLSRAALASVIGRYQLEAAIQSAHSRRAYGERVDWESVAQLYEGLVRIGATAGAIVGWAAAVGNAVSASEGLRILDAASIDPMSSYQPYWALKAHFLTQLGETDAASMARQRAIGLSEDPAVREFLARDK